MPRRSDNTATRSVSPEDVRMSDGPDPDRVARRAYQLYESRGGGHGGDVDDWLRAEQEMSAAGGSVGISNRESAEEERAERREHPPLDTSEA